MPFDWSNFGNVFMPQAQDVLMNRLAQSPIGGAYNTAAPIFGAPSLIGQSSSQYSQNQQPQQPQTNPQDAVLNHWQQQNQQTASEGPPIQQVSTPKGKGDQVAGALIGALL